MPHFPNEVEYSDKYYDSVYEYRHVTVTEEIYKKIPHHVLLKEEVWRSAGINQSRGWEHYAVYEGEPWVLLFRRPIGVDSTTGIITPEIQEKIDKYNKIKEKYLEVTNNQVLKANPTIID